MAMIVAGIIFSLVRGLRAAPCPADAVAVDLPSNSGVYRLIDALNCTGPGVYNVSVHGRLEIERKINISEQKIVNITGSADDDFKSTSNPSGYTVVSAVHTTGMFSVSNGSTLIITRLTLEGGSSVEGGTV
ncbi:MAG: hypothetical protein ABJL67_10645, partial [Sulfitobacter sp.]